MLDLDIQEWKQLLPRSPDLLGYLSGDGRYHLHQWKSFMGCSANRNKRRWGFLFWWLGYKKRSVCMNGERENPLKREEELVHTRTKNIHWTMCTLYILPRLPWPQNLLGENKTKKVLTLKTNCFVSLSLRVFGQFSSSLLLFPQRLGRYVLRPSSGVCRTREPTQNFELCSLLNPRGSPVLFLVQSVKYSCIVTRLQSGLNLQPPDDYFLRSLGNQRL